jgi:hypothetical protein
MPLSAAAHRVATSERFGNSLTATSPDWPVFYELAPQFMFTTHYLDNPSYFKCFDFFQNKEPRFILTQRFSKLSIYKTYGDPYLGMIPLICELLFYK